MKFKHISMLAVGIVTAAVSGVVLAQAKEQFIGLPSYRVGAYASGGSGIYGGWIDYMTLINEKGGVNGVKLTWEECETEYNNARGVECYERMKKGGPTGNTVFQPLSTGITYSVIDKAPVDKVPVVTAADARPKGLDTSISWASSRPMPAARPEPPITPM